MDGRAGGWLHCGAGLVSWAVVFAKYAQKDAQKRAASGLKVKAQALLAVIRDNPFQNPPPFEKLVGDLGGAYSRRINIQRRLVYEVLDDEHIGEGVAHVVALRIAPASSALMVRPLRIASH